MTNAEAIETLRANYPDACFEQLREAVDVAIQALSADAMPVVRCKDCKHYWKNHTDGDSVPVCLASPKDDAFCSEGERKDDE